MSADNAVLLIICGLITYYLFYALLRPERF